MELILHVTKHDKHTYPAKYNLTSANKNFNIKDLVLHTQILQVIVANKSDKILQNPFAKCNACNILSTIVHLKYFQEDYKAVELNNQHVDVMH